MANRLRTFFLLLLLLPGMILGQTRVLFLGNSYTAQNGLPALFSQIANHMGDSVIVDANHPGGYTLEGHLNNSTSLAKLNNHWDYVILQEQSQIPTIPFYRDNSMYPAAHGLDSIIKEQDCRKTVFYMTWGRKFGGQQCDNMGTHCSPVFADFEHMQDSLESSYMAIADELDATVSPVGIAWKNALASDSTIDLWTSDNSHPTIHGSYLAACTFYATIFGKSPFTAAHPNTLNGLEAQFLQTIAAQTVLGDPAVWNIDTTFQNVTAGFTQSTTGLSVQLTNQSLLANNYLWDLGDNTTSTSLNPNHTYAQPGIYVVKLIAFGNCAADSVTDTITVGDPTGLMDQLFSLEEQLQFYPNPASKALNIALKQYNYRQLVVSFIDITGKRVKSENVFRNSDRPVGPQFPDRYRIEVQDLPVGVYFLEVFDPDSKERIIKRFVRK